MNILKNEKETLKMINALREELNTKKYCFATTLVGGSGTSNNPLLMHLDVYDTNDNGMSITNDRITITESGTYDIKASAYLTNSSVFYGVFIYKNGSQIGGNFVSNFYLDTFRTIMPASVTANLVAGDYIQLYYIGGVYSYSSNTTFLQVTKM